MTSSLPADGYPVQRYAVPVKRYCQMLDLKSSPELIAEYRRLHSAPHIWPEVVEGIRSVGILEMEIYLLGARLMMIVETPLDFDWDSAMARLSTLPRQTEWEQCVARFQECAPGATSAQKWQLMERIFRLYPRSL